MRLKFNARKRLGDFYLNMDFESNNNVLGVFGPSGSGKSTMLRILAGLIIPEEGEIVFNGKTIFSRQEKINIPPEQRRIGYIFQEPLLFPHLNVKSNLFYGYKRNRHRNIEVDEVINILSLKTLLERMPYYLSGGEIQRVLIARALLCSPELLVMDEPFTSLDYQLKDRIFAYLEKIMKHFKIPLIYVSHSINEIMRLTDRIVVVKNGRNIAYGSINEVIDRQLIYNLIKSGRIINLLEGEIIKFTPAGITEVSCYGNIFKVRLSEKPATDKLLLKISAKEVILSRNRIDGVSARNIIKGRVIRIAAVENNLLCHVDIGKEIIVEITAEAREELGLSVGAEVYCLIKSNAIQVASLDDL